jgi:flagellar hook-associated protein 3 FlgL
MRVTNQYIYDNFRNDHSKILSELNKLNTQISSGQKIQNSYDDSSVYTDILRFQSQENELKGIKERSVTARSMTDASDSALSEFTTTLRDFQTKLISASNASKNSDNLEAIATELEEMKKHMISVANSQINGQYLFSGSSVNVKPIDNSGNYHGNGDAIMTLVGEGVEIQSNIDGKSLFLGDDLNIQKNIKTNVKLTNQISDEPLTSQSSIKEMVGDEFDTDIHFFISGTKRDGKAFKDIVKMEPDAKIEDLLKKIEEDFGSDVKVELTDNGNISITDLKSGYSQVEFKMVGVQGLNPQNETNLNNAKGDRIISFSKSNFKTIDPLKDESLQMDQNYLEKNGGTLEGNVTLIADSQIATRSTKLSDMMGTDSMPDKIFDMKVTDINGVNKDIELDLSDTSTFKVDGVTYNVYNADETLSSADDFTMGQLNDIIAMVISDELPANSPSSASEYNSAIKSAKKLIDVDINQSGHLQIDDKSNNLSNIEFAMYDRDVNDFSKTDTPSLSFMSNNAITTSQANINFFDEIDSIIDAVRDGVVDIDSNAKDPRSIGLQSAISKLEQFNSHFNNAQSQIGIRSKSLQIAEEKATALEVNVMQLKADTTEVDMAETIMKLNQVTLGYQAMLQSVSKVNSLSLLNYMK